MRPSSLLGLRGSFDTLLLALFFKLDGAQSSLADIFCLVLSLGSGSVTLFLFTDSAARMGSLILLLLPGPEVRTNPSLLPLMSLEVASDFAVDFAVELLVSTLPVDLAPVPAAMYSLVM